MRLAILAAMGKELEQLARLLTDARSEPLFPPPSSLMPPPSCLVGRMGDAEVVLAQTGIGKVSAAVGAAQVISRYHPDTVLSSGVAGGADTTLSVGDVVVGTRYAYHDAYCGSELAYGQLQGMPPRFVADERLLASLPERVPQVALRRGLIVTGDWFVDSREKMRQILARFPEALAVDMESAAIAQTCHILHVPFLSMRIVSDVPLSDHKAAQYHDFWQRLADSAFRVSRQLAESLTTLPA